MHSGATRHLGVTMPSETTRPFRYFGLSGLALYFILTSTNLTAQEVYKWIDADGNVHFSDQPSEGADKVDIKPISTLPAIRLPPDSEPPSSPGNQDNTAPTTLTIESPANGSAFHSTEGKVNIAISVKPELPSNSMLLIKIDGKEVSRGQDTQTTASELDRGEHNLTAEVIDSSGKALSSTSSRFTIHKPTVKRSAPK